MYKQVKKMEDSEKSVRILYRITQVCVHKSDQPGYANPPRANPSRGGASFRCLPSSAATIWRLAHA